MGENGLEWWAVPLVIYGGVGFTVQFVVAFVLQFFVALKARPARRAMWTASLAYAITVLIFFYFGSDNEQAIWMPLFALPGALLTFLFWYRGYRKAWVEDTEELRAGVGISNDDWRIGLLIVLVVAGAYVFARLFLYSFTVG